MGAILFSVPLKPSYSKCSQWTRSMGIEVVSDAESQAPPQTTALQMIHVHTTV